LSLITLFRKQQQTRQRVVFSAFAVVWLGLSLQSCALSAPLTADESQKDIVNFDDSRLRPVSENRNAHNDCLSDNSPTNGCCIVTHKCGGSDVLKKSEIGKTNDEFSKRLAGVLPIAFVVDPGRWQSITIDSPSVDSFLQGSTLNIRNCVYLI